MSEKNAWEMILWVWQIAQDFVNNILVPFFSWELLGLPVWGIITGATFFVIILKKVVWK